MIKTILILYVSDQQKSTHFYKRVLDAVPVLDVPGMTEFQLGPTIKLGLMPEAGIARLISPPLPQPGLARGIPRCEIYLYVDEPAVWAERALDAGAMAVSPLQPRDWGDEAVYIADPDGHVLAFARTNSN